MRRPKPRKQGVINHVISDWKMNENSLLFTNENENDLQNHSIEVLISFSNIPSGKKFYAL